MTCAQRSVLATIVDLDGNRYFGTNDCARPQRECPRGSMPTGVGYELCAAVCKQTGHAEANACLTAGPKAKGATLYLEGHSYVCGPCAQTMADYGIADVVFGAPPMAGGCA